MNKTLKKLFSLIYGNNTVNIAPGTKLLTADQFSKALDGEELLAAIHQDSDRYRLEVIAESEKIKEQASKEGFEHGFTEWADQVARLELYTAEVEKNYEKVLVTVATKAAQKILGAELKIHPDAIVDIVANTLKAVTQHKKITIYVNRKDIDYLEESRPRLKNLFEELHSLVIRERSEISEGGCIIETEGGIINAQLENQWQILERAFSAMLKTEKAPSKEGS